MSEIFLAISNPISSLSSTQGPDIRKKGFPSRASRLVMVSMTAFIANWFLCLFEMNGKPDAGRGFAGVGHAVFQTGGQEDIVSWSKVKHLTLFEFHAGLTLNEHDPFIVVLIVPNIGRGYLPFADNS